MRPILVLPFVVLMALAGCGGGEVAVSAPVPAAPASPAAVSPSVSVAASPAATAAEESAGVEVTASDTRFGKILFDGDRQAIYLFDKETTSRAACYDACAAAWPPVLTDGVPKAGGAVKASLLATTERTDGTSQVTYGGHPLYYYAHEAKNEVECHNVRGFGGLWLAVTPSGKAAD